ncbi:uncharacterized protein LOC119180043 [Rhipicephalus microplus]|uniref:uncharacterized protein LOC119180043 n=1 Tax=Rhipicephalus microplus TaxID=6941 RepID=UPI003F6B86E2
MLPKPADQAYPLLCTVGAVSESTSLPADGVCGVLFYESLYKRGLNNLTAGLGADVLRFIVLTSRYSSTTLGVSFDISPDAIATEYTRPKFDAGVDSLWQKRITHFGALSSNVDNAAATYIGKVLEMLKHVRDFLAPKQTAARHVVTAIGVSPAYPADFERIGELIDQTFAPDMFVAVSHLSIRDDDRPDCLILPPTIYTLPDDLNLTYATTLNASIELLRGISATAAQPMLALSFTMQGRYYAPRDPAGRRTRRLGNFDVFKPCAKSHGNQTVAPGEACQDQRTTAAASYRYRTAFYAALAYDRATNTTLTFDSDRALQSKVCASKRNAVTLRYGIAVYDVEDDGWPGECSQFTLRGQFCRLCMLRRLNDFISTNYTEAKSRKAACRRINPEMIGNFKCA